MDKRAVKNAKQKVDEKLDQALEETFPGSDPVSFIEPAPVKEQDKELGTVKTGRKKK
jgi:hypothetical protein